MKTAIRIPIALAVFPCLLLVLLCAGSWAVRPYTPVHPDPVLEPWRWRTFPELKGLGLRCMAEDRDGNMWFGTDEGVRVYDGVKWTAYTEEDGLPGAPVNLLCAARDGGVYAGTEMGIGRFSGENWTRVFPPEGDHPWLINDLMEAADRSLWAGTAWGALHLSQDRWTLYTTEEMGDALRVLAPYVQLSIVPDGAALVRPWNEGSGLRIAEGGWLGVDRGQVPAVIWSLVPGGPGETSGLKVGDRIIAVGGHPLITQGRLDGSSGTSVALTIQRKDQAQPVEVTLTRQPVEGTFRAFPVFDVFEDRTGAMWFGLSSRFEGGEIVRYDIRTPHSEGVWQLYRAEDGLSIGYGPRIAQTRNGTIWTVSNDPSGCVNRFDGASWTYLRLSTLGGDDINPSILETGDGALWVSGFGALHVLREGEWVIYRIPDASLPYHRARLLETSKGALWISGMEQEAASLDYRTVRWTSYGGMHFQCETPDGAQWFLSRDSRAVRYDGRDWVRYGIEDGLMDAPSALIATREGGVWAAGSHAGAAATARFERGKWSRQVHPTFSQAIHANALFQSSDGSLWFGSQGFDRRLGYRGGVLRFGPSPGTGRETWTRYTSPGTPPSPYAIGQTSDGTLWFGGGRLRRFDGQNWSVVTDLKGLSSWVHEIYGTEDGLWVGTRTYGIFHFDGQTWKQYDVQNGLADNLITGICQTDSGSVWVATGKGVSRFDGRTWTTHALPPGLRGRRMSLRQSRDGALWINLPDFRTSRYEFETDPPETEITVSLDEVSQPGNTILSWVGADPWHLTLDEDLQYAWRLDEGVWSPFSPEKNHVFFSLSSGDHTFEVKARDGDFNEDPTPAVLHFTVVPPVWQEPWFVGLMAVLLGAIGFQTVRVVRRDRRLQESNAALSDANRDLFGLNRALEETNRHLREAQAQLVQSAKMASLGNLVAGVAHEINTPIGAANSAADVSGRCIDRIVDVLDHNETVAAIVEDAQFQKALKLLKDSNQIAVTAGERIARIVRTLRNFARLDESDFQEADVHEGLDSTLTLLHHELKNRISVVKEYGEIPPICCYPNELNQVFMNLLVNAIQAIEGQGTIRIETTVDRAYVYVKISDTGVGIPPRDIDRIFDPGFTTKGVGVGTGLGLSISYNIVQKHRGKIEVESEVGKGSTFTVRIPNTDLKQSRRA